MFNWFKKKFKFHKIDEDDFCAENAYFRLERMDDNFWWVGIGDKKNGIEVHFYLTSSSPIKLQIVDDREFFEKKDK